MTISRDLLQTWWDKADDENDEQTLALINEVDRLKHELGLYMATQARMDKELAGLQSRLLTTAKKKFRQGQAFMRDRVVLSLFDEGCWEEACIAQSVDGQELPEDLNERLTCLCHRIRDIHPYLSEEWARRNKDRSVV